MRTDVTLYLPQEVGEGENRKATIYYKGIKEFKQNPNGTVTFKTQKHGTITTPLFWRLSENLPDDAPTPGEEAAPAGNQARRRVQY